jgi:protein-S-isoprenylcysteine O-methyltransferase Ste14
MERAAAGGRLVFAHRLVDLAPDARLRVPAVGLLDYHSVVLRDVFYVTLGVSAAAELSLQRRTRSDSARDPSYVWMIAGSFAGIALAFAAAGVNGLPGPRWLSGVVGLTLMWTGFALRVWAVRTLGEFFRVEVSVEEDQRLVDTGPYARLRHPSYTGLLIFYLGLGIALDSYLSVAAAVLLPLAAIVNRIGHEERALRRELGEQYDVYSMRTARLIPGVW